MNYRKKHQNEKWLNDLKTSINHYETELPEGAWERLNASLDQNIIEVKRKKRTRILFFSTIGVAATLLLLLTFNFTRIATEKIPLKQAKILTAIETHSKNIEEKKEITADKDIQTITVPQKTLAIAVTPQKNKRVIEKTTNKPIADKSTTANSTITQQNSSTLSKEQKNEKATTTERKVPQKKRERKIVHYPVLKKKAKKWNFALAASPNRQEQSLHTNTNLTTLSYLESKIVSSTLGEGFYAQNNIPIPENQPARVEHKQPIQFGVYLAYHLSPQWAIQSGVFYTQLHSTFTYNDQTENKQSLHYLGLPLDLQWYFWKHNRLSSYISLGGAMEFPISSKYNNETIDNSSLQWSVRSHLGLQYEFISRFHLFTEIGGAYYFDNGNFIQSIRTQHRLGIHFSLGFRFSY
jgi:hypothetical protein